jgi:hypothetical protein
MRPRCGAMRVHCDTSAMGILRQEEYGLVLEMDAAPGSPGRGPVRDCLT